jgi:hypothetical protein
MFFGALGFILGPILAALLVTETDGVSSMSYRTSDAGAEDPVLTAVGSTASASLAR